MSLPQEAPPDTEATTLLSSSQQRTTDTTTFTVTPLKIFTLLTNVFYLLASTYGLIVCHTVASTSTGVCAEEITWVRIFSIFGFLSFCPLLTVTLVPKLKMFAECVYGLVVVFLVVWMIYGANVFFQSQATSCPAEIHYLGFSLAITFLSLAGVSCCCFMCMYNSLE
jgi:hypothetical protein